MKKNKLYILLSIFIIIMIFGTAASCNFCGIPIKLGEVEEALSNLQKAIDFDPFNAEALHAQFYLEDGNFDEFYSKLMPNIIRS